MNKKSKQELEEEKKKAEKEKKRHIELIESINDNANIIAQEFKNIQFQMLLFSFSELSKYNNEGFDAWEKHQKENLKGFFKKAERMIRKSQTTALNTSKHRLKELGLEAYSWKETKDIINEGYQDLLNDTMQQHKKAIIDVKQRESNIIMKSEVSDVLNEAINQHIKQNTDLGIVEYKNGRKYKWENYIDMKVRTELRKEGTQLINDIGKEFGIVFRIASCYGDCAKDHLEGNGAIFYDEDYASMIDDEAVLKQVEEYIKSNKLMSIQQAVGEAGNYFTTRPNCRHYFQYISVQDVLALKTEEQKDAYREENLLNEKGKYNEEQAKAFVEQRYNERQIRRYRERIDIAKQRLDSIPKSSENEINDMKSYISKQEAFVKEWEKKQRKLMKDNPNLMREKNREQPRKVLYDFEKRKGD